MGDVRRSRLRTWQDRMAIRRLAPGPLCQAVLVLTVLTGCTTGPGPWGQERYFAVPQAPGPELPAHMDVPQIAFQEDCPTSLAFYRGQLERPDDAPNMLQMPIESLIAFHGTPEAATNAVKADITQAREEIRIVLGARPLEDWDARHAADERLALLSDRVIAGQAVLAALECMKARAPRTTPTKTSS